MKMLTILLALPALVAATGCSTPYGSGTCMSTSSCTGFSVSGYCPGGSSQQCCLQASCSTPSGTGACKNTSKCGGTSVSGYCPGPSGVKCCVGEGCNTPSGSGVCMASSSCSGKTVGGYCSGPSAIKCCVDSGTSCSTPSGSGSCKSTSSCSGFSLSGYCPGGSSNQCCITGKSCSTSSGSGTCLNTGNGCSGGSFISGACPGSTGVKCCVKGSSGGGGGNLPGLDSVQTAHARAIIAENNKEGLGSPGCKAAITTALTESNIHILANKAVPASESYPNDGYGSDHKSIGIFQQQSTYYPNISCDMDAACSASQFFSKMKGISGYQTMDTAVLCQKVQVSAYPTAYERYTSQAASICSAAGV